jgi:hypothetical protein
MLCVSSNRSSKLKSGAAVADSTTSNGVDDVVGITGVSTSVTVVSFDCSGASVCHHPFILPTRKTVKAKARNRPTHFGENVFF